MNSQFEIPIPNEAFCLVPEKTQDGDRLARSAAQREADRQSAARNQLQLQPAETRLADAIRLCLAQFLFDTAAGYDKIETCLALPNIPAPVRNQLEAALGETDADFAQMHVHQALMMVL